MIGLYSLPLEIWLTLSRSLLPCDFWALLACGNRALNSRLRLHHLVTHLQLDDTNTRSLKAFLAHGSLDKVSDLSFHLSSFSAAQEVLAHAGLRGRFTHLRSLEFDRMPCWLDMLASSVHPWNQGSEGEDPIDIASLMPSLERFYLYAQENTIDGQSIYSKHEIPALMLPETTQSLELYNAGISSDLQIPPHITKLHIPQCRILSKETVAHLPKTITSLEAAFGSDYSNRLRSVTPKDPRAFQTVEYQVEPWLTRSIVRELLNCHDFSCPSDIPSGQAEALSKLHAHRFDGWGCARLLPNLTHLGISETSWYDDIVLDVLMLPDTLKSLSLSGFVSFPPSPIHTESWPPTITSLALPANKVPLLVVDLPSSLLKLTTPSYTFESPSTLSITSATDAKVPAIDAFRWVIESTTPTSNHWKRFFHDGLHTIKMNASDPILTLLEIGLLPRTLTHLEWMSLRYEDEHFQSASAKYSNILRHPNLDMNLMLPTPSENEYQNPTSQPAGTNAANSSLPPLWPPNLTTFLAGGSDLVTDSSPSDFLHFLPTTLTHYRLRSVEFDRRLSASLAHLASQGKVSLKQVSRNIIASEALRLWQVSERRYFEPWVSYGGPHLAYFFPYAEEVELYGLNPHAKHFLGFQKLHTITCSRKCHIHNARHLWQYLPPTLTYMQMIIDATVDLTEEFILNIPSNIVTLKISHLPFTLVSVAAMFPTGKYGDELNESTLKAACDDVLVSLEGKVEIGEMAINISKTPTDTLQMLPSNIVSIYLSTDTENDHFYSILPSKLTRLRLTRAIKFRDDIVHLLPGSLLHLQVDQNLSITNEGIKKMPPLTTLILHSNSRLTSDCIPFLPSTLTCLDLHAVLFTDTFIDRLPTGLTDLDISWSPISQDALKLLPRGLTSLDIENNELLQNGNPTPLPRTLKHLRAPSEMLKHISADDFPDLELSGDTSFVMQSVFD